MTRELLPVTQRSTPQRTAAVALVLVQIVAIAILMQATTFATFAAIIALTGWLAPRYGMIRAYDRTRWFVFAGVLFGLKSLFAPTEFDFNVSFVNTPLAHEIACYCIVLQLMVLFMKRYEERLPLWTLGISITALIFISDVRVNSNKRSLMLIMVMLFLFAWSMFSAASRAPVHQDRRRSWFKYLLAGSVLVFSLLAGTGISIQLHHHEKDLESALTAYLAFSDPITAETGFSGRGGLSDVSEWKRVNANAIALRVSADNAPGYLRGKAFDTFKRYQWNVRSEATVLLPVKSDTIPLLRQDNESLFLLKPVDPVDVPNGKILRIWPVDENSAGNFFLPLHASALSCRVDSVHLDQHLIPTRTDRGEAHPYSVLVTRTAIKHSIYQSDPLYLELPENIDPRVEEAVRDLDLEGKTNVQKMRSISKFFREKFQYKLGIRIPRGEDRLGYFIANQTPAHCEYFASATTVMLRLSGVPARYVTGYLCEEQNKLDGTWLSRRQDAHAWVEAYDDQTADWVIVESTPEGGVPSPREAGVQSYLWEWMTHWLRTLQYLIRHGDVWGLLWSLMKPIFGVLLLGLIVFGIIRGLMMLTTRTRPKADGMVHLDPRIQSERKRMDRYLARFGLRREQHEPILKFTERIQNRVTIPNSSAVSDWYHHYLTLRFGNNIDQEAELRALTQSRKAITSPQSRIKAELTQRSFQN